MWKKFANSAKRAIVNLSLDSQKEIMVAKICNQDLNNVLGTKSLIIDTNHQLFMAFIPATSKIFVNLFCCNITMEDIHKKFTNFGLAIEGCFNIEKISNLPNFYRGYNFLDDNYILTMQGVKQSLPKAYLVVDNHRIQKIVSEAELSTYKPIGVNVQYIEGLSLYENGRPQKSLTSLDKKLLGCLVLAIDKSNNIIIFYHNQLDISNVFQILNAFDCQNAILLCASANAHLIWKRDGQNTYNQSDFIGNPVETVSNVMTFSA
jgi:hypothetical protein